MEAKYRARFESRFLRGDGCWLWLAGCFSDGYGCFWDGEGNRRAHRVSYELYVGAIPDDLELDHLCRVTICVNPRHLEPVTSKINSLRGIGFAAVNARKTHCSKGHPYGGDNLGPDTGRRRCRACGREQTRAYRAKHAGDDAMREHSNTVACAYRAANPERFRGYYEKRRTKQEQING